MWVGNSIFFYSAICDILYRNAKKKNVVFLRNKLALACRLGFDGTRIDSKTSFKRMSVRAEENRAERCFIFIFSG